MKIVNLLNISIFLIFGCLLASTARQVRLKRPTSIESTTPITISIASFQEIEEEEEEDIEVVLTPSYIDIDKPKFYEINYTTIKSPIIFRYQSIWKPPHIS
jgi:hypothetical protein